MDFRVPRGCTGLSFADGTRYEARGGRVVVDNPRHARQVHTADQKGHIAVAHYTAVGGRSHICRCGFIAYGWQSTCPRCGAGLTE